MGTKRSNKAWKTFDFDEPPTKIQKKHSKDKSSIKEKPPILKDFNFESKITPESIEDLAVHSKKITEIQTWLELNVLKAKTKENGSILLITGPTGCGKTITVTVVCKTLGIKVLEWINPIDKNDEGFRGPGQTEQLLHFLSEAKFPSLMNTNKSKIVLIEDFPNSFINNSDEFLKIIKKSYKSDIAVVFICTDTNSNNINLSQKLFPQEIINLYKIKEISFNSCSSTLLKQSLKRVQTILETNTNLKPPNQDVINNIIVSSMGDIRCAVNQFYFACLKDSNSHLDLQILKPTKNKNTSKRKLKNSSTPIKEMMKDECLDFFHSLGRVLNPKRVEKESSWRLQANVNTLIDELSIQPSTFSSFLHENYFKYFGNLEDVCKTADCLSTAQVVLGKWSENQERLLYGLWISVLGVMVNNEHRVSKWTQINAPKKFNKIVKTKIDDLNIEDRYYFNIITKTDRYKTFY